MGAFELDFLKREGGAYLPGVVQSFVGRQQHAAAAAVFLVCIAAVHTTPRRGSCKHNSGWGRPPLLPRSVPQGVRGWWLRWASCSGGGGGGSQVPHSAAGTQAAKPPCNDAVVTTKMMRKKTEHAQHRLDVASTAPKKGARLLPTHRNGQVWHNSPPSSTVPSSNDSSLTTALARPLRLARPYSAPWSAGDPAPPSRRSCAAGRLQQTGKVRRRTGERSTVAVAGASSTAARRSRAMWIIP